MTNKEVRDIYNKVIARDQVMWCQEAYRYTWQVVRLVVRGLVSLDDYPQWVTDQVRAIGGAM